MLTLQSADLHTELSITVVLPSITTVVVSDCAVVVDTLSKATNDAAKKSVPKGELRLGEDMLKYKVSWCAAACLEQD